MKALRTPARIKLSQVDRSTEIKNSMLGDEPATGDGVAALATSGPEQVQRQASEKPDSLDHLVRAAQQRQRHCNAERLCGSQVEDQFDFSGLLDG
jgi:hypothetical protein